ncbi:MAG: HEAT repeat domain-containing protein [Bacteroidota bacterium]
MTRLLIFTIICSTFFTQLKADSWIDPSWKRMLDSSDMIALIQYTSNGDFRASAKITSIYKGQLKVGDEIWVSGFSNHYGPIDKMKVGDQYLVFLNLSELTEQRIEYWNNELLKKTELKDYIESLKNKRAFYVCTPTSGDLKVNNNKVQYDLIQTTFYSKQNFYSLQVFEFFLKAYNDSTMKNNLSKELLNKIKKGKESESSSQDLMMLSLLKYNQYDNAFDKYAKVKDPSTKYALAQLMGNMNSEKSKQILLVLIKDKHSLVQGEAVRQLSNGFPNEVGAVLLKQLKDANPYNSGPKNIMDPVMNHIDGGKSQIIKTLGNINYKPAIPELLTLLDTKDDNEFELIVQTLRKLGTRTYASYINKHLDNLDYEMVLQLCFIIRDDSLTECIPSLMNFVKKHNRTILPTQECTISKNFGLAHFKTDSVKEFLSSDFLDLMKMPNTNNESIDTKKKWVNEYILSFTELGIHKPKDVVYDYMFDYYGFNSYFKMNPKYFQRKYEIEDSLAKIVEYVLKPLEPNVKVTAVALIDSNFKQVNYSVKYKIDKPEGFDMWGKNKLDTLNQIIFSNTQINKQHLVWSAGNYTGTDGAINFERFGDSFMNDFLEYISVSADKTDVVFIENLIKYNYAKTTHEKEKLDKYLLKAKTNIGQ